MLFSKVQFTCMKLLLIMYGMDSFSPDNSNAGAYGGVWSDSLGYAFFIFCHKLYEPHHEKTCFWGF